MAQETNWNISFTDTLNKLIDEINTASLLGDTKKWFNSLRTLYRNIAGYTAINKTKMEEINKEMLSISDRLHTLEQQNRIGYNPDSKTAAVVASEKREVKKDLDKINISLVSAMHEAGLVLKSSGEKPSIKEI